MRDYVIFTDSACDIPAETLEEWGVGYRSLTYTFDGDDQLSELNDGITELVSENQQLRKRVTDMRNKMASKPSNDNTQA